MLEPRKADVPVLFLVLVVLPLVAYVLLGRWSEVSKKRERISLLAQLATEEALRAEAITTASVTPLAPSSKYEFHVSTLKNEFNVSTSNEFHGSNSKNGFHACARCFASATTRCSRCKSVRYCSGKCQIIHWRQVHKHECQRLEKTSSSSSPLAASNEDSVLLDESWNLQLSGYYNKQAGMEKAPLDDIIRTSTSRCTSATMDCSILETSQTSMLERRTADKRVNRKSNRKLLRREDTTVFDSHNEVSRSSSCSTDSTSFSSFSSKEASIQHKPSRTSSSALSAEETPRSHNFNRSNGYTYGQEVAEVRDTIPAQGSNGVTRMGILKMTGLRKSTKLRHDVSELWHGQHRKIKMLFPYEEFVILFQYDALDLSPSGLVNCGNSCYANAVLQCLTCTKPLVIYLLRRSHSSSCCRKDWCLMCELEQHVMMLRESGGPLSSGRILSHMRSISCQIGDGSQEDAHEFLRLLVASMQSICLERHGGESKVDPKLQETTFIQHTFGGRLWSKVKCLRCYHESERYENIMDLTLEIFGWVESLEDALTQFTTPEDLDGENMYKCARCAAYVRARKQLNIHEAPNILTIVLKRFQEGRYGKINKCITFPELLDMIPFMTGTGDTPPLYTLYAVVVHLDTQNASFSGHYVSYVKNMQGTWLRIDDTEVYPVPMSQVMSEGAYILFYMRSCPRPQRVLSWKAMRQVPDSARHSVHKTQKPSGQGQSNPSSCVVGPESDIRPEIVNGFTDHASNGILRQGAHKDMLPVCERCPEPESMEFSDATSSDWSLFTSSDEASFTTESARDSFSTVDYADACNVDPFYNIYSPESASHNTVCCRTFSSSKPQTWFISSEKGCVLDSYPSTQSLNRARRVEN